MEETKLELNEKMHGALKLKNGDIEYGRMEISIIGPKLTVYHTEIQPEFEGKGYAKKLLSALVEHARMHHMKIIALCPYVHAQFRKNPEAYADIWEKD